MTDQAAVLVERDGAIMIITINWPERRNAVNLDVHIGVGNALDEANRDPGVRAVILTGAGQQAFCAGADLKASQSIIPTDPAQWAWGFGGFVSHYINVPTIAAINGLALGGGMEIVLASDLAIADESAVFGLPEVKRGVIADSGGAFRMASQIAPKLAMEIVLTGDPISAARALELGLINMVAPQGCALDEARKLAARIAANAPIAVQASKRLARGIVDGRIASERAFWKQAKIERAMISDSEDAREGRLAFVEKRPPQWKGR